MTWPSSHLGQRWLWRYRHWFHQLVVKAHGRMFSGVVRQAVTMTMMEGELRHVISM